MPHLVARPAPPPAPVLAPAPLLVVLSRPLPSPDLASLALRVVVAVLLVAAVGCSSSTHPGGTADATQAPDGAVSSGDPFAPQPDESEGLTNVSADLGAVLENGQLAGACDRYKAGATDRKTLLLCGKWQFFYEAWGTAGMPAALVTFEAKNFPAELGVGFTKLGMILDPTSADMLPLGLAPTKPSGTIQELAFTCASCHFGKLSDGRYAVGAPNHSYDYGRMILSLVVAPTVGLGLSQASAHDPTAIAKVQPMLDRLAADSNLKNQFLLTMLPLASQSAPTMTTEVESYYAEWPLGTMDFVIAPLPADDHVHTVSKIIGLWGIPRPEEQMATGMANALLGCTGDAISLDTFIRGFATLGGTAPPSDFDMKPLLEYIYSLRAPSNPHPPDAALVATGAQLYTSKGCATCHDGPRGSGKRAYTFAEIGTDPAMAKWADPTESGSACCGLDVPGMLTHGIKSPRMVGEWALGRFLHNGTLETLDQLFCLTPRPPVGTEPMRTDGHAMTCDGLTDDEKHALEAYLLAH